VIQDNKLNNLRVEHTHLPNTTWALTAIQYEDDTQSGGNHNVYFKVVDPAGNPLPNVKCNLDWVNRDAPQHVIRTTDQRGEANEPLWASFDPQREQGPYFAYLENQSASDLIKGMGLPLNRHVNYRLAFTKGAPGPITPPPTLEQAAQAEAKQHTWMPINEGGALYKFALKTNLGYPQTDEFEFLVGADIYVGQVYNLGIVYVKKGDWGNCKWVKKP
jgi:hypothetical protein